MEKKYVAGQRHKDNVNTRERDKKEMGTPKGQTSRFIWDEAPAARGGKDRGPRMADGPAQRARVKREREIDVEFGCSCARGNKQTEKCNDFQKVCSNLIGRKKWTIQLKSYCTNSLLLINMKFSGLKLCCVLPHIHAAANVPHTVHVHTLPVKHTQQRRSDRHNKSMPGFACVHVWFICIYVNDLTCALTQIGGATLSLCNYVNETWCCRTVT